MGGINNIQRIADYNRKQIEQNTQNQLVMKITKKSPLTGVVHTMDIDVTEEQLYNINHRTALIQRIVPHLSLGEREFLMTGITDEEWQLTFADMVE